MKNNGTPPQESRGFALVVTLSLMILLTIIAVGLLTLSSISLRASNRGDAMARARSNAKLALMIAIGELQKNTGPDTRITASSTVFDPSSPPLVGAWKSWGGSDHDSTGRPIVPDYDTAKRTASSSDPKGRFLTWLVSGTEQGGVAFNPAGLASKTQSPGSVPLLSTGSLGTNPGQLHVQPRYLQNQAGAYAWWVSGENQKALLAQPYKPRTDDIGGYAETGQSHTVTNPEVFGLPSLLNDPEFHQPDPTATKAARKSISRQSMALIDIGNPIQPQKKFHDLSSYSVGLLTNTATGGWRKDLSILTEKWDAIYTSYPTGKLPLFRFTPDSGATSQVPKPTTSNYDPKQSNLYPWSEYSLILGYKQPCTYHAASASWASLQSFATSYKNMSYSSGAVKSPFVWDRIAKQRATDITSTEIYNNKHKQLLYPQIARFQFLVYATTIEDPARLGQNPKKYQMRLRYVPIFTLWNPYNVSLETTISGTLNGGDNSGTEKNFRGFGWRRSLPGVMAIANKATYPNPSLVPYNQYKLFTPGNVQNLDDPNNFATLGDNNLQENKDKYGTNASWRDVRTVACWLAEGTLAFKPGEAKIFSPDFEDTGYGFGGYAFRLKEGYTPSNVVGMEFGYLSNLLATQSFWFLFKNDRVTQPYKSRVPGNGFSLSFGDGGTHFGGTSKLPSAVGSEFHNITSLANVVEGNRYWPPTDLDEVGYSVGELAGQWIPLYSVSFGPRMALGTGLGTKQSRPTKGVLQNDALAGMVLSDPASGNAKDHPANNTFDFAYHTMSIGSTITPNLSNAGEAYIATGYQSGDGLSRLIMDEIPLRPMASLVELQGWNPRGHNPYPPMQMNLIGNSDATPLIPNDNIVPPTLSPSGFNFNLQHDDAYCANHLLFDDWFVSSIAPQPQVFGGSIAKNIETVYKEYLMGQSRLANRAYRPISEDSAIANSDATTRIGEILNAPKGDGWLKVASRFEVDGMFNVNSTSVEAWKALLGHAKSLNQIAMHGADKIVAKDVSNKHGVTRGSIASDIEAGTGPGFGGQFANASEYSGFRNLSETQIQDLATKIVEQVRLRGPFLSLSEFVNRQLSTNTNLALAGAVQTAINNLSADPMKKLRDPANSLSDITMSGPGPNEPPPGPGKVYPDPKLVGANYAFTQAAEGSSAYGVPGWIRQADILRPIAPVLSARDDTFTIRAYGDARDRSGKIVATAWCEATVQRSRNFVDAGDPADSIDAPSSKMNQLFGRKYVIVSFRWLNHNEV